MAGLEVLYSCVSGELTCPQDAVVALVHWEMILAGFRCVGSGDQPRATDRKSELLPGGWSSNKEVYSLRYRELSSDCSLMLKAITVDCSLIFNLMNCSTQQVSDLTVIISDHINVDDLHTFDSVFRDPEGLSQQVRRELLPPQEQPPPHREPSRSRRQQEEQQEQQEEQSRRSRAPDHHHDPLRGPSRHPRHGAQPHWPDPLVPPFGVGGADLDPFGSGGGMLMDPLRSGYPRPGSGLDPSSGIPDILPPGAVPPGARFDPFGPPGGGRHSRPGPDPDHLPPPGYDDMFM